MSVFKSDNTSIEERVKVLEKKVRQIEKLLGKKPSKDASAKSSVNKEEDDEEFCVIT